MHQLNCDDIIALAKETSGLVLGHLKFLGALQNATTTLWNALAPSDHDDELSEEALLKHIQSRWVLPIQ